MSTKPIIFDSESVRGILDGRKTMTRRLVGLREFQALMDSEYEWTFRDARLRWHAFRTADFLASRFCKWHIGDRLWVKETWQAIHVSVDLETGYGDDVWHAEEIPSGDCDGHWGIVYAATDPAANDTTEDRGFPWRSPLYMPHWASRIELDVTGVRIERLQNMPEADVYAEGIDRDVVRKFREWFPNDAPWMAFRARWDEVNGKRAPFDSNPPVLVVNFKLVDNGHE